MAATATQVEAQEQQQQQLLPDRAIFDSVCEKLCRDGFGERSDAETDGRSDDGSEDSGEGEGELVADATLSSPRKVSPTLAFAGKIEATEYPRFQREYKALRLLGRGAFGEVWHSQRLSDGKEFAVKVVRYRAGGNRQHEEHALREAQMLAMMNHPNILHYHGAWIETPCSACSTVAGTTPSGTSSCPSSPPLVVVAPPPSPAFHQRLPPGKFGGLEPDSGNESDISYGNSMEGTLTGGVVFLEFQDDDEDPVEAASAGKAATASPEPPQIATGFRASPPMPLQSPTGAGTPASVPPPPIFRRQRSLSGAASSCEDDTIRDNIATLYIQVELCRDETLQGWILKRNTQVAAIASTCLKTASDDVDAQSVAAATAACTPWAKGATRIFIQCLRALGHLHAKDCVHRDVKPSNILFARGDGSCAVRLGDLGLAKVIGDEPSGCPPTPQHTPGSPRAMNGAVTPCGGGAGGRVRSGPRCETVGTPSYASPEQLAGKPVGAATDVYALGLVLAELLCPVSTQMERATVLEALRAQRELPSATVAAFPELARLAISMTEPDPSKRPKARQILRIARQVLRRLRRTISDPVSAADGGASKPLPINKGTASWQLQQTGATCHRTTAPGAGSTSASRPRRRLEQQAMRKAAAAGKQQQAQQPEKQQQPQQAQRRRGPAALLSLER